MDFVTMVVTVLIVGNLAFLVWIVSTSPRSVARTKRGLDRIHQTEQHSELVNQAETNDRKVA